MVDGILDIALRPAWTPSSMRPALADARCNVA
jgi:hypothetical protein